LGSAKIILKTGFFDILKNLLILLTTAAGCHLTRTGIFIYYGYGTAGSFDAAAADKSVGNGATAGGGGRLNRFCRTAAGTGTDDMANGFVSVCTIVFTFITGIAGTAASRPGSDAAAVIRLASRRDIGSLILRIGVPFNQIDSSDQGKREENNCQ
jgi:hypothetical protein